MGGIIEWFVVVGVHGIIYYIDIDSTQTLLDTWLILM